MKLNLKTMSSYLVTLAVGIGGTVAFFANVDGTTNFLKKTTDVLYEQGISMNSCNSGERIAIFSFQSNKSDASGVSGTATQIATDLVGRNCKIEALAIPKNKDHQGPNVVKYFFQEDMSFAKHLTELMSSNFELAFENAQFIPTESKNKYVGYVEVWVE
ncbi:MAG: hypothetical protein V3U87_01840 [Methylococcaceae bacterium]